MVFFLSFVTGFYTVFERINILNAITVMSAPVSPETDSYDREYSTHEFRIGREYDLPLDRFGR